LKNPEEGRSRVNGPQRDLRPPVQKLIDEAILLAHIVADPPRLSLVNHVHRLVTHRSPRGVQSAKILLGLHAAFDRTMVLLEDVVQILDWSMAAAGNARFPVGIE
jgi:hypothetical protein